jgi:hypothetical protein
MNRLVRILKIGCFSCVNVFDFGKFKNLNKRRKQRADKNKNGEQKPFQKRGETEKPNE